MQKSKYSFKIPIYPVSVKMVQECQEKDEFTVKDKFLSGLSLGSIWLLLKVFQN